MDNSKFNLSLREVLTFWEMVFLQQDCGNDSSRDLHPALTTYLDVMFGHYNEKLSGSSYHRPWVLRNALKYKNPESPNRAGAQSVVTFFRECADVLEEGLKSD